MNLFIEGFYYPYWNKAINEVVLQQLRLYNLNGIVLYVSLEDLAKDKDKLANTEVFIRVRCLNPDSRKGLSDFLLSFSFLLISRILPLH